MNSLLLQTGITIQLNLPLKISDKGVNFLDTTVHKGERFHNQGILDIHTHLKPTETGSSHVNCRNKKGLLNFVSERINLVYRINNTTCYMYLSNI